MTQQTPGPSGKSSAQAQAEQLLSSAFAAVGRARAKAGELTRDNRGRIDAAIGKAAGMIDERTGHKYSSTITKVRQQAAKGIDLVQGGHGTPAAPGTPQSGPTAPADPTEAAPTSAEPSVEPPPGNPAGWRRDADGNWVPGQP